jgi:7,8-dihydroneopterin aldolase/epimerase/oxygenase
MDRIEICGLEVECIIGIHEQERHRPQRVVMDVELGAELAGAGRSGQIANTCDYDVVAREITDLVRFRRYELMETAAEELCAMLFSVQPSVERVALRIAKPAALETRACDAAVWVERDRGAYPPRESEIAGSCLRTWLETYQASLHTLNVGAGHEFEAPHDWVRGSGNVEAWLITGRLRQRDRWLATDRQPVRLARLEPQLLSDTGAELFFCVASRDYSEHRLR